MTRVLITGASGFIGSFLVEEGLRQPYEIYAGVRSSSSLKYLQDKRIHILPLELSDPEKLKLKWQELKTHMPAFDYVIHNAGVTQVVDPLDFQRVNSQCTQNLVQSLTEANFRPKKFILMSSLAAHGPGNSKTLAPIEPADTPTPITYYGKSKLMAEQYLTSQQQVPYLIFRPTAVYGPRDKDFLSFFKTIKYHLEPYLGSPQQQLSFIYVKDLARLIFHSLESNVSGQYFFASDGNNYTCSQLAAIAKTVLNKRTLPIRFPKPLVKSIAFMAETIARLMQQTSVLNRDKYKELTSINWGCNATQTLDTFNFKPAYNLEKGVREVVEWYQQNKWL
ncbi:NAD(P)-dependent oxidoreductase [Marinilabiliaceae bacterium JC017]|nr:NAD(P)-dependent oxidoreductase [Marinilabiliaceae bacterium JC017]